VTYIREIIAAISSKITAAGDSPLPYFDPINSPVIAR
jgi:hypothetical protein